MQHDTTEKEQVNPDVLRAAAVALPDKLSTRLVIATTR